MQGAKGGNKFFIFELPAHVEGINSLNLEYAHNYCIDYGLCCAAHAGPPPSKRQRSMDETSERAYHHGLDTKLGK